jgi:Leucine-rich repeat (LRR) protein
MFPHYKELGFAHNSLSGPIPAALANLVKLQKLNLFHNMLSGSIDTDLGSLNIIHVISSLRSLQILDLGSNCFNSVIPASLSQLIKLRVPTNFQV